MLTDQERSFYEAAVKAGYPEADIAAKIKERRAVQTAPSGPDRFRGDIDRADIKTGQDYEDYLAAGNPAIPDIEAKLPNKQARQFIDFAGGMAGGELAGKAIGAVASKVAPGAIARSAARASKVQSIPEAVPKEVSPFDELTSEVPFTPQQRQAFRTELQNAHGGDIPGVTDKGIQSATSEDATNAGLPSHFGKPVRADKTVVSKAPEPPNVVREAIKDAVKEVKQRVVNTVKHGGAHAGGAAALHYIGVPNSVIVAGKAAQVAAPLAKAAAIGADEALAGVARAARSGTLNQTHVDEAIAAGVRPALVQGMVERLRPPEPTSETEQPE